MSQKYIIRIHCKKYDPSKKSLRVDSIQNGRNGVHSISRQHLNENLETLHLAPTLFYYLPGFYLKSGFLYTHPLFLTK